MATKKKTAITKKMPTAQKRKVSKKKSAPGKAAAKKTSKKSVAARKPAIQTLTLDSVAIINHARSLHQEFNLIAKANKDVNIDASAIEMIDTAVLQLLFAFVIKIKATNHQVHWINPSDEFVSRAEMLGLSRLMDIT